jgi:hypothetical protein
MSLSPQEIDNFLKQKKVSAIQQTPAIGRNPCLVLVRNPPVQQQTAPGAATVRESPRRASG